MKTIGLSANPLHRAAPFIADGLAILGLFTLLPARVALWRSPGGINALWLTAVYILFLLGVWSLRKLAPLTTTPLPLWLQPKARGVYALLFGVAVMTALAYQLGYFEVIFLAGPEVVGEGESAALFVFGPGAWLFLSMFYIFVLAFPVRPTVPESDRRHPMLALLGVSASNGLLLLITLQLMAVTADPGIGGGIALFLGLWVLFGPPRLLFAHLQANRLSLASLALVLLCCSWQIATG